VVDSQGTIGGLSSTDFSLWVSFACNASECLAPHEFSVCSAARASFPPGETECHPRGNPVFLRTFHVSSEETNGRVIYGLGNRQWDIPKLRELFCEITTNNARIDGYEVRHKFQHLGRCHMILKARRIAPPAVPK